MWAKIARLCLYNNEILALCQHFWAIFSSFLCFFIYFEKGGSMKLKELRSSLGLTQSEIAGKLGISRDTYKNYEQERTQMNYDMLIKLADYFDVSLDFLLGRPRPYDIPSVATEEQKQAINIILQLNAINTLKAFSYCAGLLASQS